MENIFKNSAQKLIQQGFELVSTDFDRPWGGFFVIDENQAQKFADIEIYPTTKIIELRYKN